MLYQWKLSCWSFLELLSTRFGIPELMWWKDDAGNRSSVDESSNGTNGPEDETTVVEPEQGNGMPSNA
jgi:hypothetical protein